jgi:hypothetical protein
VAQEAGVSPTSEAVKVTLTQGVFVLAQIKSMMERAAADAYAVGYFESWNLKSLQLSTAVA